MPLAQPEDENVCGDFAETVAFKVEKWHTAGLHCAWPAHQLAVRMRIRCVYA